MDQTAEELKAKPDRKEQVTPAVPVVVSVVVMIVKAAAAGHTVWGRHSPEEAQTPGEGAEEGRLRHPGTLQHGPDTDAEHGPLSKQPGRSSGHQQEDITVRRIEGMSSRKSSMWGVSQRLL